MTRPCEGRIRLPCKTLYGEPFCQTLAAIEIPAAEAGIGVPALCRRNTGSLTKRGSGVDGLSAMSTRIRLKYRRRLVAG